MKLEGLRVLDLSAFLPGPHMTMMMADHGADVIMIEPANGTGEPTRALGFRAGDGVSVWFRNIARGKKSLKLDLKDPGGHALFMALARDADVIVEAFRPGVVRRLKVDYDTISRVNPRVVYCSISAFGQTSPLKDHPAHDLAIQALAGTMALGIGREDGKPALPNMPSADVVSSLMALSAILMALLRREKTGAGDYIDLAMYDALLAWTPNVTGPVFAQGRAPVPGEMRSFGGAAMNNIYETRDGGYIVLGGSEVKFAEALLGALGRPDLVALAREEPGPVQAPLKDFFRETFRMRTKEEWEAFLEPLDVAWAPLRTLKDAFDDPDTAARGMLLRDAAGASHIGVPIRFRAEPGRPDLRLPDYGEHSAEIAAAAGLDEAEIARLKAKGTI